MAIKRHEGVQVVEHPSWQSTHTPMAKWFDIIFQPFMSHNESEIKGWADV